MQIPKSVLLEILESLRHGLSTDDIIDESDCLCFLDDAIYTYNDRIWVLHPLQIGFTGAVKADRLLKHIKKAGADKNGMIELSKQSSELIISSGKKGKTKAGFPLIKTKEGHGFNLSDLEWFKLPKGFTHAIKQASYYASSNYNKPKLTCVHCSGKIIEASDGNRGYRHTLDKKLKKDFLIPAHVAYALKDFDFIKYAVDYESNWFFLKTKEGSITALRMPGEREYVDADFLFEMEGGAEIDFPEILTKTIDKAVDFIGEEEQFSYLRLQFDGKKNRILISSESDHGWFRDPVKFKSDLQLSFFINPFFLKDILKSTFSATANTENGLLLFEADDWKVVINITLD